jgi:hypothetical protein
MLNARIAFRGSARRRAFRIQHSAIVSIRHSAFSIDIEEPYEASN